MKPIIAITAGEIKKSGDEWAPMIHGQAHTYIDAVLYSGCTPFILPVIQDTKSLRQLYDQAKGLLLSGGNDIDPIMYGAEKSDHVETLFTHRDRAEMQLLLWALEDDKPILGICRGMQLLNIALGGTLHQDISKDLPGSQNHRISNHEQDFSYIAHNLKLKPGSRLSKILGAKEIKTNDLHHQAINKLGEGLEVTARAEDGIIEAFELPNKRFVIGVQSHPEALFEEVEPGWRKLFEAFAKAAAAKPGQPARQPAHLLRAR